MKRFIGIIVTGGVIGAVAVLLVVLGNPGNMGFCIACFLRDMAGAMKLQTAPVVQYFRPEIVGLVLGALAASLAAREFQPRGGSSPLLRFVLGAFVMVGALMFLGCPLRMVLRIGGGDLNAVIGLLGFSAGILLGVLALHKGFSLKRTYSLGYAEGAGLPVVLLLLFGAWLFVPALFAFSKEGPGSMAAPVWAALAAGLVVGVLAQRTRLCMVGGIRDAVLFRDFYLLCGFAAILAVTLIGNAIAGKLVFGIEGQPIAHTDGLWNFLGMVLVGWGCVLLGGCPLRQLILTGEGNSDSAVTVLGMIVGAAFCHNFGLASSAEGPTFNGQVAVIIGLLITAVISVTNLQKRGSAT